MSDPAARIEELKTSLQLQPHVEGGHYHRFHPPKGTDNAGARHAMSAIHYLLEAGQCSSWHRVDAEEAWHFVEGEPLELLIYNPITNRLDRCALGPLRDGATHPVAIVPAGSWQAARPLGAYTLATCLVAPGFRYEGFELLAPGDPLAAHLAGLAPEIPLP